jgi:hypothetical protein
VYPATEDGEAAERVDRLDSALAFTHNAVGAVGGTHESTDAGRILRHPLAPDQA